MKFHSLTLFSTGFVLAAAAVAVQASTALPPEQHAGGVGYVSGGVSDDEASAFKAMSHSYPLTIEIVQRQAGRNEFTADADVKVLDRSGSVLLDAKADGPFMLVRVPPGEYRVQATLNGRTVESKPVHVSGSGSAQAMLAFPPKTD